MSYFEVRLSFVNVSFLNFLGLLELPAKIETERLIRPVEIPNDCGKNIYTENVVSVGKGWTNFEEYTGDKYLRYADLVILPMSECKRYASDIFDSKSVICTFSTSGQSIYAGDSGEHFWLKIRLKVRQFPES